MKKKILIVVFILISGTIAFLAYDWHVKTNLQEDDQRVTLYSWKDKNGTLHFTNTQPPDGARDIEERKGFEYTDRPLVAKIKDKTVAGYKRVKEKIFKKKKQKK